MHIFIIILLITSVLAVPSLYSRKIGGGQAAPAVKPAEAQVKPSPSIPSPSSPQAIASKDKIMGLLDALLQQNTIDEGWHNAVNNLIFDLALLDKNISNAYFKKIIAKIEQGAAMKAAPLYTPQQPLYTPQQPPLPSGRERTIDQPQLPSFAKASDFAKASSDTSAGAVRHGFSDDGPVASKNEIIAKLDEKLRSTIIDDAWYVDVNNLIFDLALLDRNVSNEYLKKIRIKTTPAVVPQPSAPIARTEMVQKEEPEAIESKIPTAQPMKKGTPPPPPGQPMKQGTPPPPPGQAMKKGTPPPPPAGGMKQGTPPPPPPGAGPLKKGGTPPPPPGPMVKGKKAAPGAQGPAAPAAPKGPEPLSIKETYGARQLEKRSNEEIIELFNKLLDALGTYTDFWDVVKKEPKLDWKNRIDTVKKALLDPQRNIQMNAAQMIEDRIKQVRQTKAQQGLEKQLAAEKAEEKVEQEEYSEAELIKMIEALKQRMDPSDFKWSVKFQGNIKKLDKVNHEKAVEYEAEFIKNFPDQKPFLPQKKEAVVKKELTEEEKIIANIDKILSEKSDIWVIKVREPIQKLYDMNPARGLEYQDKYIAAIKEATKKEGKPFLKLKE